MNTVSRHVAGLFLIVLLGTCCASSAATLTFNELSVGALTVPGTFQSGGVTVDLTGPGGAFIEVYDPPNQWLRLNQSAAASLHVPPGTTRASFHYYHIASLASFTVNGESLDFQDLAGNSGTVGGVNFTASAYYPTSQLERVDLSGPIGSLSFLSGFTLNALLLEDIRLVPEPASAVLLGLGAVGLIGAVRRRART